MSEEQLIENTSEESTEGQNNVESQESTPAVDNTQPVVTNSRDAEKAIQQAREQQARQKQQKAAGEPKAEKPEMDYQKAYKEIQSLHDKQMADVKKQLSELQNLKQFAPVLEQYQQQLRLQQQQQLAQKFGQDPVQIARQIAQQEIQQHMAPLQEMQIQAQATEIDGYLRTNLGEQYNVYAPLMSEVLDNFQQSSPEMAKYLAANPQLLYLFAKGVQSHQAEKQGQQNQQLGQDRRSQAAKAAQGIARGSQVSPKPVDNSLENMSTEELKNFMKAKGIMPNNL